jgi:hypothetical protein
MSCWTKVFGVRKNILLAVMLVLTWACSTVATRGQAPAADKDPRPAKDVKPAESAEGTDPFAPVAASTSTKPAAEASKPAELVITDIVYDPPHYLRVKYKNQGGPGDGRFLIRISANGRSFPGNPYYKFKCPEPGIEVATGGFTIGLIGLHEGMTANVTAEIYDSTVRESKTSGHTFSKQIVFKETGENSKANEAVAGVAKPGILKRFLDAEIFPHEPATVNAGLGGINTSQERAQTFTVSVSGTLAEIDVFAIAFPPGEGRLILDLRRANPSGSPTMLGDEVLGTFSVLAKSAPQAKGGFVAFDVSSLKLLVKPGEKLAAVLRASDGASSFGWLGWSDDPYPSGESFERTAPHNWVCSPKFDLGLRSYVLAPASRLTITPREIIVTRPQPAMATVAGPVRAVATSTRPTAPSVKADLARAYYGRGVSYQKKGNHDSALADFTAAIRLFSEIAGAELPPNAAGGGAGASDRLIEIYSQTIRNDPSDTRARYLRGLAYQRKGEHSLAESDFAEAARLLLESR